MLIWLWVECCKLVQTTTKALWLRGREKADVAQSI
jgi:hypothetical protein